MAGEITLMKRHWSVLSALMGRLTYVILPLPRWIIYGLVGLIAGRPNLRRKAAILWASVETPTALGGRMVYGWS